MDNLNYGVIGNCKSAALISDKASIDFLCLPVFSSFTVFGKLLDDEKGGEFGIHVSPEYVIKQNYIKNTNILITHFQKGKDQFDIIDFMPRYDLGEHSNYWPPDLIRHIKHISGKPQFTVNYNPKLWYAKHKTHHKINKHYIKSFTKTGPYESLYLYSSIDLTKILDKETITIDHDQFLLLSYNQKIILPNFTQINLQFERTKVYWLNWSANTTEFPIYNEEIYRSALVLKLLTYEKTGALIAAVTTSLPETIGEVRNWDYRFCWLRDASMTVSVLVTVGHAYTAKSFLNYVLNVIPYKNETIQIMYGIHGEKELKEETLPHLSGYLNSKPVRIGNAAYKQQQHDIYGVLLDLIYYNFTIYGSKLDNTEELWTMVRSLVRHVTKNWKKPDQGIWEFRQNKRHFVFSKVLCWVALDRAIKIATILGQNEYILDWYKLRDIIKTDILANGWNSQVGAFTQSYGSHHFDAANLLMEDYGFIKASDPKYVSTVQKTKETLCKDGLMYRYSNEDDFGVSKSAFTVCTFWMIHSLYKIGEKEEAIKMFNRVLSYRNYLGLFSEDIDFKTKRLLGNFPQAYSHIALIKTAITLSQDQKLKDEHRLHNIYHE